MVCVKIGLKPVLMTVLKMVSVKKENVTVWKDMLVIIVAKNVKVFMFKMKKNVIQDYKNVLKVV
jgi:hypothetical protein